MKSELADFDEDFRVNMYRKTETDIDTIRAIQAGASDGDKSILISIMPSWKNNVRLHLTEKSCLIPLARFLISRVLAMDRLRNMRRWEKVQRCLRMRWGN